jgi:hypothetical protein
MLYTAPSVSLIAVVSVSVRGRRVLSNWNNRGEGVIPATRTPPAASSGSTPRAFAFATYVLRRDFPIIDHILPSDCSVSTVRFRLKGNDNAHFAPAAVYRCKQRRSCRLFPERCWDRPSILLNSCVPAAKDLPSFDWGQSVASKIASSRWDGGACLQPHCLAGWYGLSGR